MKKDTEIAAKLSSQIDQDLKRDLLRQREARKREVKVLLLGQAESGKSTLQKQFQLYYAAKTLDQERRSWIPVVYFNIIKALRMIFSELEHEVAFDKGQGNSNVNNNNDSQPHPFSISDDEVREELSGLRVRLLPLLALENSIASELSGGVSVAGGKTGVFVRSGWQSLVSSASALTPQRRSADRDMDTRDRPSQLGEVTILIARTLVVAVDIIEHLWTHEAIRQLVKKRRIRLDDSAAYFLNRILRICDPEFIPNNNDILHVRLQTLGVMEHTFPISTGGKTYDWKLYDVGGARGQRRAWIPFFDDATAIIFLAPISAFDQYLEEDPRMNRIEDSLTLFTSICGNKLLKDAHLVVLLNKIDVLREKLDAGMRVQPFITSFGKRANNFETVSDYFRSHFQQAHRKNDVSKRRPLYVHFTSMLDIHATRSIISHVGEAIIRKHIMEVGLA